MTLQSRRISLPRAFIAVLGVLGSGVPACWWPGPYIELTESAGPVDPVTSGDSGGDLTGTTSSEETSGADTGGDTGGDTDSPPLDCPLAQELIVSGMSGVPKALYQDDKTCDIFLLSEDIDEIDEGVRVRRIGVDSEESFVQHEKGVRAAAINSSYLSAVMGGTTGIHTLITWDPTTLGHQITPMPEGRMLDVIATRPSGPQRWLGIHEDATIYGVLVEEGNNETETKIALETNSKLTLNALYPVTSGRIWVVGLTDPGGGKVTNPLLVALDLEHPQNNAEIALPEEAKSMAKDALSAVLVHDKTVYAAGYRDMDLILLRFAEDMDPKPGDVFTLGSVSGEPPVIILESLILVGDSLILAGHEGSTGLLYRIPLENPSGATQIDVEGGCALTALAPVPGSTSSFLVAGDTKDDEVELGGQTVVESGGFIARLSLD